LRLSRSAAIGTDVLHHRNLRGLPLDGVDDSAKRSAAGISSQCDGTLTASGRARLAPGLAQRHGAIDRSLVTGNHHLARS
jgi:hypothetical protein